MERRIVIFVSFIYVGLMTGFFFYLHSIGDTYRSMVAVGGVLSGLLPIFIASFSKWKLHLGIVFSYLLFLFASEFLGSILNWYGFGWWDTFLHFISGGILAFIGLTLYEGFIYRNNGNDLAPWFVFLITVSIAAFAGVIWEIYEFLADHFFGTTLQGIGVTDTMTDLMADVVGGLVIASYAAIRTRKRMNKNTKV